MAREPLSDWNKENAACLKEATEDQERLIMDTVLRILDGKNAELSISALTRVLQPLLIGIAKDQREASEFVTRLSLHLKACVNAASPNDFGFLRTEDGPILYKRGD
jgi:hypothetical protein